MIRNIFLTIIFVFLFTSNLFAKVKSKDISFPKHFYTEQLNSCSFVGVESFKSKNTKSKIESLVNLDWMSEWAKGNSRSVNHENLTGPMTLFAVTTHTAVGNKDKNEITLAKKLNVVLPISFFERDKNSYFNSVMIIDADGDFKGVYRKSHIPQGPGYEEKFYFSPGNSGFKVWDTAFGCIGVGICWDQWFPECARSMALMGADLIFYPTAIGSEPEDPTLNSVRHWQRAMQGHAASNMTPIIASNRVGQEIADKTEMTFYGHSFISDETGKIQSECNDKDEDLILHSFNLNQIRLSRASWGLFRDRRPELYDRVTQK